MADGFNIPRPGDGETLHLNLVQHPKSVSLWWSLRDRDGWIDGGHVSTHRTRLAAKAKSRVVADWIELRATTPSNEAEHPAPATASVATPSIDADKITEGQNK